MIEKGIDRVVNEVKYTNVICVEKLFREDPSDLTKKCFFDYYAQGVGLIETVHVRESNDFELNTTVLSVSRS